MMPRTILAALALLSPAVAQDLLHKAAPQRAAVVLEHATIHTVAGATIEDGSIWFADGKIRAVLPAGRRVSDADLGDGVRFDLQGLHVFPGLISSHTSLGLVEIGAVPQSVDTDELGDLSPEAIAATAVNPDSAAIPVARSNGVLAALTFPAGGSLPGRASVIQLDGWTNADMALRRDAGPVVSWPAERSGRFRFRRSSSSSASRTDRSSHATDCSRRRSANAPFASPCSTRSRTARHSSGSPSPVRDEPTSTGGAAAPACRTRIASRHCCAARLAAARRSPSALWTSTPSASSITPRLMPCSSSPAAGDSSKRKKSTMPCTAISDCPVPIVSTSTTS